MSLPLAIDALKRRDFAAARALIAQEKPGVFQIPHFLVKGLAEMGAQDWAAVEKTFATATACFPDHAVFWLNLGLAQENTHQREAAILSYERCLALDPAQGEACGNLSNLYRLKNRFSEAETLARRALTCGVDQAAALNALGLALAKQEKFAEAENAFCRAQTLSPAPADILVNRANLAVDQLQFDKAWDLFAAARALQDSPLFRHHEALARLLVGDRPGGLALFDARLDLPGA